ncbi:Ribonucleoprotein PTB-binding 2 [Gossypium arboreum]|uniref:Ribonucleoprotein PTB-binding 2 n=1 Tax=Gossypium arboreum TaxID=29729 RepID=A0A0B0P022_GOSAR|nr:Ribonucleoprotein PTB-binding 2 [Gossypium arboreum]
MVFLQSISRREFISYWKKEMSSSVVLKMLGRNLGITTLYNRLYGIWKPSKPF